MLELALLRSSHVGELVDIDKEIVGECHLGIKLIAKVDVVEEILAKFLRQQANGKGTLSAPLLTDEDRHRLIAMQHIHLQPMSHSRTQPDGAPVKLLAG